MKKIPISTFWGSSVNGYGIYDFLNNLEAGLWTKCPKLVLREVRIYTDNFDDIMESAQVIMKDNISKVLYENKRK